jgi:SsrA-binding protein
MGTDDDHRSDALIASNRKARHDYTILDVVEAGIVLLGSEVKSIAPYQFAVGMGSHEPVRRRKLLLHADQIRRLNERMAKERLTLVPLEVRFRRGRVKVDLALAKGRQKADRRQAIAKKESELEMRRAQGRARKAAE